MVEFATSLLPQGSPPESGFLRQESWNLPTEEVPPCPAHGAHITRISSVSVDGEVCSCQPLHFRKPGEDLGHDEEGLRKEEIVAVQVSHHLTGSLGETLVEGCIVAIVWLRHPMTQVALGFGDNVG
jgi:hypothetical protein